MNQMIIALFVAFAVTAIAAPFGIPLLQRLKMSQTEREEGVQSHLQKAGTPTMGGLIFLAGIFVASMLFVFKNHEILPVLIMTFGFGAIGFFDDYLKKVKRDSDGLLWWQKLGLQFIITTIFCIWLVKINGVSLELIIPWSGGRTVNIGFWAVPLLYFAVLGTVNGVNFTDGLDGLATTVTAIVAGFFAVVSYFRNGHCGIVAAAVMGALLAFLLFNVFPAKVFMGDTGSLALGGFVVAEAYMLQMPIFIILVGFIYLVEVVSVIMQVGYFKVTHGKRIFKMAPIHHHFELCGWSETRVVAVFSTITLLLCLVSLIGLV